MADVKISGLNPYKPVDDNVLFVGSWKSGSTYTTYSATGNEIRKYVLHGIKVKSGGGLTCETHYGDDVTGESYIELSTNLDTSLYEVVTSLPESNQSSSKIYLMADSSGSSTGTYKNEYVEYAWITDEDGENPHWEILGKHAAETDLSGYYKKTDVDGLLDSLKNSYASIQSVTDINSTIGALSNTYALKSELSNYLTSSDLEGYATEEWVESCGYLVENDLADYAKKSDLPTSYLTDEDLEGYATEDWVKSAGYITSGNLTSTLTNYVSKSDLENASYLTEDDLEGYAKSEDIPTDYVSTSTLEGLTFTEVGGEGKYISKISQTNGKISATASDLTIAANKVTFTPTTGITSENVQAALVEIEGKITDVTSKALSIKAGSGINIVPGSESEISVKLPTESAYIKVNDDGLYLDTTNIDKAISDAVTASEKKIFGDGELATAFDTIKEIGDYLKDHDDVAVKINAEIAKKADSDNVYTKDDIDGMLEDASYLTSDALEVYALQSWVEGCGYVTTTALTGILGTGFSSEATVKAAIEANTTAIAGKSKVEVTTNPTAKTATIKINDAEVATVLTGLDVDLSSVDTKLASKFDKGEGTLAYYQNAVAMEAAVKANENAISQKSTVEVTDNTDTTKVDIKVDGNLKATVLKSVDLSSINTQVESKFDKGEGTLTYNSAKALEDYVKSLETMITTLQGTVNNLVTKLGYYDTRFGYPASGTPSDENDWTVSFLRID